MIIYAVLNEKEKREISFQEIRYASHPQISLQAIAPSAWDTDHPSVSWPHLDFHIYDLREDKMSWRHSFKLKVEFECEASHAGLFY